MIPFTGHVSIRQHIRGKPYPTGLKNFVLADPTGEVLDFQGKNSFPDAATSTLSIGGLAVLRLTQTLPAGCSLFVDRYFTSIRLLDCLLEKGITVTGTIMKNLVPRNAKPCLKNDTEMKRQGRGSINQIVCDDNKICITQWYDNKAVLSASSEFGAQPNDSCKRWSKEDHAYIEVPRPAVIKQYNDKMGGVDLSDRMIPYYRIGARTRKWTIRTILHMVDLSLVNAWLQERQDMLNKGTQIKHLRQFLDFRLAVSEDLLFPAGIQTWNQKTDPPQKRIALPPEAARNTRRSTCHEWLRLKCSKM
ncbi:piggyBac transposable element-derived protein 3-like [Liolophura sinensis]|uniref:piggyBac transposable element-derived protein 3-like n=1 Tax=Liolophura sinensis TaxID=3198878 RepID=UPI0031581E6E